MKLRQAVLYWRRWDAGTVVTHNVIKLELAVSDLLIHLSECTVVLLG